MVHLYGNNQEFEEDLRIKPDIRKELEQKREEIKE